MLRGLGLDPVVRPADIDETPLDSEAPDAYVRRLARGKAEAENHPGELVIAADTIVVLDGRLLGKPRDPADARTMLSELAGRAHEVQSGVALLEPATGRRADSVVQTRVVMSAMTEAEIAWYVDSGEPLDKAGSYGVQGLGALFVERVEGNYSNVVGLPLPALYELFRQVGYDLREFRVG